MPLDVDYVVGKQAIEQLDNLLRAQPHMGREAIVNEIEAFVATLKKKYKKSKPNKQKESS